jgi:hypothetical protein
MKGKVTKSILVSQTDNKKRNCLKHQRKKLLESESSQSIK